MPDFEVRTMTINNQLDYTVVEFYHDIQFPGYYTQEEVMKKSQDFLLSKFLKISYLPYQGKILEAGCGTGYTTHIISNLRRDTKITAIDFSRVSLAYASNFSKKMIIPTYNFNGWI